MNKRSAPTKKGARMSTTANRRNADGNRKQQQAAAIGDPTENVGRMPTTTNRRNGDGNRTQEEAAAVGDRTDNGVARSSHRPLRPVRPSDLHVKVSNGRQQGTRRTQTMLTPPGRKKRRTEERGVVRTEDDSPPQVQPSPKRRVNPRHLSRQEAGRDEPGERSSSLSPTTDRQAAANIVGRDAGASIDDGQAGANVDDSPSEQSQVQGRTALTLEGMLELIRSQNRNLSHVAKSLEGLTKKQDEIMERLEVMEGGRQTNQNVKMERFNARSIEKYKCVMLQKMKLVPEHFSKECLSLSIGKVSLLQCMHLLDGKDEFNVGSLCHFLQTVMFSLKPSESKSFLQGDLAKNGFKYRTLIVLDCLRNAQLNVHGLYSDDGSCSRRPPRPCWLEYKSEAGPSRYLLGERELKVGFDRHEKRAGVAQVSRRAHISAGKIEPTATDYGDFLGHFAFSEVTKVMNNQRRNAVHCFGESIGYLLAEWGDRLKSEGIRKESLTVRWKTTTARRPPRLNDIPKTEGNVFDAAAMRRNVKKFADFVNEREEFHLFVTHDVLVTDRTTPRKRGESSSGRCVKRLSKAVSLLDSALSFLYALTGASTLTEPTMVLSLHPQSIAAVYLLAEGFRDFLAQQTVVPIDGGLDQVEARRPPNTETSEQCRRVREMLNANAQIRDRYLNRQLHMSLVEFKACHTGVEDDTDRAGVGDGRLDDCDDGVMATASLDTSRVINFSDSVDDGASTHGKNNSTRGSERRMCEQHGSETLSQRLDVGDEDVADAEQSDSDFVPL